MPLHFRVLPTDDTRPAAGGVPLGPPVERLVALPDAIAEIRIGRRTDIELPLPFAALSAVHARLAPTAGTWAVEDLGSTNGTWLDGQPLSPGQRLPLAPGAELRLGNVRLRFEGPGPARPEAQGTATIARRIVDDLFATSGVPTLLLRPARRFPLPLTGRPFVVGRAETCGLSLPVDELSREHAAFIRREDGVTVRDLGSKNGVIVAGARIINERSLSHGDVIKLGPITLTYEDPAADYLRQLEQAPEPAPVTLAEPLAAPKPPEAARRPRPVTAQLITAVAAAVLLLLALATAAIFWPRG